MFTVIINDKGQVIAIFDPQNDNIEEILSHVESLSEIECKHIQWQYEGVERKGLTTPMGNRYAFANVMNPKKYTVIYTRFYAVPEAQRISDETEQGLHNAIRAKAIDTENRSFNEYLNDSNSYDFSTRVHNVIAKLEDEGEYIGHAKTIENYDRGQDLAITVIVRP